ncbi:MAG: thiamine phosphate synthase [Magnetovibrionaceae bacterium]
MWRLLLTDDDRLTDPGKVLRQLNRGDWIILRSRSAVRRRELFQLCRPICRRAGIKLIIAGTLREALRLGADGVHLSEQRTRSLAGPLKTPKSGFLISTACHSAQALARVGRLPSMTAALISPVFETRSHPGTRALGRLGFYALVRRAGLKQGQAIKLVALGGMTANSFKRLTCGTSRHTPKPAGYAGISGFI